MADGDALVIGQSNNATGNTTLRRRGSTILSALYIDTENGTAALGRTTNDNVAIFGISPAGPGVEGSSGGPAADAIGPFVRTDVGVFGKSVDGHGVEGASITNDGVFGSSQQGVGVEGFSSSSSGVVGVTGDPASAGVFGLGNGRFGVRGTSDGVGVRGESPSDGTGVEAFSQDGDGLKATAFTGGVAVNAFSRDGSGVKGQSFTGHGVDGRSDSSIGIDGSSRSGVGVFGFSSTQDGVVGQAGGDGVGTSGFSNAGNGVFGASMKGTGVHAEGGDIGLIAFSAGGEGIEAHGGDIGVVAFGRRRALIANGPSDLNGNTQIFGNLVVHDRLWVVGAKHSVVPHPDGSQRALYAMESPDCVFEDFGRAQVVNGRARVELDRDFAALVELDDYHVFLTPEGDSNGLYIKERSQRGFEVREQQRGRSNLAFSYRIVAARKDLDAGRLPKVRIPEESARSKRTKLGEGEPLQRRLPPKAPPASSVKVLPPKMSKSLPRSHPLLKAAARKIGVRRKK